MSSDALPISPHRFAAALESLPLSSLHLKAAELRNSIAHLDYSNEQLREFTAGPHPDEDCVDAIRENEEVIKRMEERIALLKQEVERRGFLWGDLDGKLAEGESGGLNGTGEEGVVNGEGERQHEAWRDGTFTTGRITGDGDVVMDERPPVSGAVNGVGAVSSTSNGGARDGGQGGRLTDEQLRRALEERLGAAAAGGDDGDEDGDEGMHL